MTADELARRALTRPIDERRAQKLRDRIKSDEHARDVLSAIESRTDTTTRDQVAQQLTHTRKRFR